MPFRPQHMQGSTPDSEGNPVYMQDWFTAVAAKERILRVEVVEDRNVVASLSCSLYRNPFGMRQAYNLPWVRVTGPIIDANDDPARRRKLIESLISQLPRNRSYFLTLSNEDDFRIFLASGFDGESEDNFVIPADQAKTWERGLSKMSVRHLRSAEKALKISAFEPEEFIRQYAEHLAMRRRKPYADLSIARDILIEATRRGQARVSRCSPTRHRRDRCRRGLSVGRRQILLLDDDPPAAERGAEGAASGSRQLLMYAAINHAHAKGLTFDFDGVTSVRVAKLYAGMGGTKSVRYRVKRGTICERLASVVRSPVKAALRNTLVG